MSNDTKWQKKDLDIDTIDSSDLSVHPRNIARVAHIFLSSDALIPRERELIYNNGDVSPHYVRMWLALSEFILFRKNRQMGLAILRPGPWWRSRPDHLIIPFMFADLVSLLGDSRSVWVRPSQGGLVWVDSSVPTNIYDGCIFPAEPNGLLIMGDIVDVDELLEVALGSF